MPKYLIKYQIENRIRYYGISAVNEFEAVILHHQKYKTKILSVNESEANATIKDYRNKRNYDGQGFPDIGDSEPEECNLLF